MDADAIRRFAFTPVPGAGLAIERTEGCWLVAAGGHRILDAAGGAIVSNIGHGRAEVGEAMARASARATYVVPPFATEERVRLVERLRARWLPEGLTRVLLTSGGSESVDAALRIARQHCVAKGREVALEGDRSRALVSRHHAGDARGRRSHEAAQGLRAAAARLPARARLLPAALRALSRALRAAVRGRARGADPARGAGDGGRVRRRADRRLDRRRAGAAGRLLAAHRRDLPAPRRAADRRRGDDRLRAHRAPLRRANTLAWCRICWSAARGWPAATRRSARCSRKKRSWRRSRPRATT